MTELYPLLMMPEFHERVWGTRDLAPIYSRVVGKEPIGEVWLTGNDCKVANGPLAGQTLTDLCKRYGTELVGEAAPQSDRFPLLIKFLFPKEKLSVQVHPDDEGAKRIGQPSGKTECWYVYKAMPGATVGLGLKSGTTLDDLKRAIEQRRAEELMNWINVRTGELIYVDAGTVHAIAPGSILVETQQNSDTTYRLYDYGRPRELHVEQGLQAVREHTSAGKTVVREMDGRQLLVESPSFVVEKVSITDPLSITAGSGSSSTEVLVAIEGSGVVQSAGVQPVNFNKGEAVVIPAATSQFVLRPQWSLEILRMRVPTGQIEQPKTTLA